MAANAARPVRDAPATAANSFLRFMLISVDISPSLMLFR
jgi:hypothetical protein